MRSLGDPVRPTFVIEWRLMLWLAILVGASCAFSLGFACAVPLAAFGAAAALTLDRAHAVALMVGVWAVNQAIGFGVLQYPTDASSLEWGAILGVIAVLSAAGPQAAVRALERRGMGALAVPAAFVCAAAIYECGLFMVSALVMGGTENYTAAIVARILGLNLAAFVALLALNLVARASGVPVRRLSPTAA